MQSASPVRATLVLFDVYELDVEARQLKKRNRRLKVQDLPLRLLIALVERPGEIISREQLGERLWGNTAVEVDDGLHTAVRKLRKVLGDSASHPKFIETVPRCGYRFLVPVACAEDLKLKESKQARFDVSEPAVEPPNMQALPDKSNKRLSSPGWIWMACGSLLLLVLIAVSTLLIKRPHSLIESFVDVVPITSYRGLQRSPSLSPDGSKLAFIWVGEAGTNLDLYVQRLDGSDRIRLTTDPAPEESPAWSPDGKTIAFIRNGSILFIPATGGEERRVTSGLCCND